MKVKRKFDEACVRFGLIEDGDRILVGLSGGKDSLALVTDNIGQRIPPVALQRIPVVSLKGYRS